MSNMFSNWDVTRVIRLVAGAAIGIYAIISTDYVFLLLAGMFLMQAVLNISCCGASGCSTNNNQKQVYKDVIKPYKPDRK